MVIRENWRNIKQNLHQKNKASSDSFRFENGQMWIKLKKEKTVQERSHYIGCKYWTTTSESKSIIFAQCCLKTPSTESQMMTETLIMVITINKMENSF